MWVLTVFEEDTFRIYEFETKEEAEQVMNNTNKTAILSYTNLTLVA